MFQKIKPKRISDEIYFQIRDLILNGELKPGQKLPPERELAESMSVSRPSLREALNKLVAQGYLEQVQGGGTYVKSITATSIDNAIEEFVKRDEAIFDLMEVRKILETWAAYAAAERATDKEINNMFEFLEEMRIAKEHGHIGYISDTNFHFAISHATHNVLLVHVMNNIYQWIERVSYEIRSRMHNKPDSHELLFRHHTDIFEAIKSKDPNLAYGKMLVHMDYIQQELERIFNKSKQKESFENS